MAEEPQEHSILTLAPEEISRFLMHYIGGGTSFPFDVLEGSARECASAQPVRVLITDSDFDRNYAERTGNAAIFAQAAERSARLVMLLHAPQPESVKRYRAAGADVIAVNELDDFPRMAAALSRALFTGQAHEAH